MAEREGEEAGGRKRRGRVGCEREGVKGSTRLRGVGFGSARGKVEVQESAGRGPGGKEANVLDGRYEWCSYSGRPEFTVTGDSAQVPLKQPSTVQFR